MSINRKIKDLRKEKGYKQSYISFRTGIPQSTLSRFENGKCSLTIIELEKILLSLDLKMNISIAPP